MEYFVINSYFINFKITKFSQLYFWTKNMFCFILEISFDFCRSKQSDIITFEKIAKSMEILNIYFFAQKQPDIMTFGKFLSQWK